MIGKILAHYKILSQIGRGGMGEVYRAKDQKLGRDVAIKVLPEEFAKDAGRVSRFQREAKLLASLNHPNIATIHGLEESDGTHFLVMELVEGITLEDYIAGNAGVPAGKKAAETAALPALLKLALQIAEALEAAHEKGVIHRDLKPANIKITPEGKVKVLDFGLAKAFADHREDMILSDSPTLSVAATRQGVILGTAAYMSPEQARGKDADKRADIWAFGCVLYEMLTGQAAFQGEDVTEIIASVVKSGVNLEIFPVDTYPGIREILTGCLQKDFRKRYRDIGDVKFEIEHVLSHPGGASVQQIPVGGSRLKLRRMLPWAAAVLGMIVAGLGIWNLKAPEPPRVMRFDETLNVGIGPRHQFSIAVSPDGTQLAYGINEGLYLCSLNKLARRPIPLAEEAAAQPFFSPDGQWVGYFSTHDSQLKKISINGGTPVTLCDVPESVSGVRWDSDGTIVFCQPPSDIMRIPEGGGVPESIIHAEHRIINFPQILPGGKSVLFTDVTSRADQVVVQMLKTGERKELFEGRAARYLPTGHIVYLSENSLATVPFDAGTLKVTGNHIPIEGGAQQFAVSDSGTLAYIPDTDTGSRERTLVWVDREGQEEAISAPPRQYSYPRLSPDGTRVALRCGGQERGIWIWDLVRENLMQLAIGSEPGGHPIWEPDGKRVAFSMRHNGSNNIYWQAADGSGSPEMLTSNPDYQILPEAFSPDGTKLLFSETVRPFNISLLNLDKMAEPEILLGEEFDELNAQISPDGRWLAYQSDESGQYEIYVRPFPDVESSRHQISTEGGTRPLWSGSGDELFYVDNRRVVAVFVETGETFSAGQPEMLFRNPLYLQPDAGTHYSVNRDGERFLMIKQVTRPAAKQMNAFSAMTQRKIVIVLNWFEELMRRAPPD